MELATEKIPKKHSIETESQSHFSKNHKKIQQGSIKRTVFLETNTIVFTCSSIVNQEPGWGSDSDCSDIQHVAQRSVYMP